MTTIDIRELAPEEARIHEDGELVAELFRDETAFDEDPPFYTVHLSDDPRGARRVYAREQLFESARWTVDPHPLS